MGTLEYSTWEKTDPIESSLPNFFQVFSDLRLILNYTPTDDAKGRYLLWGGGEIVFETGNPASA